MMKNKPEELEQFAFNLKGVLAGRRLGDRGIKKFALARALYHPYESEFKAWWLGGRRRFRTCDLFRVREALSR